MRRRASSPPAAASARDTRVAILLATLAFLAVLVSRASADPVEDIVRARLVPFVPTGLGVGRIHLPARLAALDVAPAAVAVDMPSALRLGRPSVRVTIRGQGAAWVPVQIAPLVEVAVARRAIALGEVIDGGDLELELRAVDGAPARVATLVGATARGPIAAGAVIDARDVALAPALPRGTQVAVELRRGAVRVRGVGTLELAARPGEPATARLAATRGLVRGVLVAPATLVVEPTGPTGATGATGVSASTASTALAGAGLGGAP